MFPIEQAEKNLLFTTRLKHRQEDELKMYSCGVRFGETVNFPVRALLISPTIESEETSLEDAQDALAHACGVVFNHLIDANIPHNVLVADEGMTVFVIPRKFDMLADVPFHQSFETVCGYVKYKTAQAFAETTMAQVSKDLNEQVSLPEAEFAQLKKALFDKFNKEYASECSDELTA